MSDGVKQGGMDLFEALVRDDFRLKVAKPASDRLCQQIAWKALNWRGSCSHPSSPLVFLVYITLPVFSIEVENSVYYYVRRKVFPCCLSSSAIGRRIRLYGRSSSLHELYSPSSFSLALALFQSEDTPSEPHSPD